MERAHVHYVSFFSAANGLFSHPSPPFGGEEDEKVVFHPQTKKVTRVGVDIDTTRDRIQTCIK